MITSFVSIDIKLEDLEPILLELYVDSSNTFDDSTYNRTPTYAKVYVLTRSLENNKLRKL